jgi:hypothetical protein
LGIACIVSYRGPFKMSHLVYPPSMYVIFWWQSRKPSRQQPNINHTSI